MSAHARPFKTTCDEPVCGARATEEVFNTYNAPLGKFCARHARIRVRVLCAEEKRSRASATDGAP